jgi:hemerythrin superfamily protein
MPNGIDLILADHQTVNELFDQFEASNDANIIGMVVDKLKAHDDAEQAALYPFVGVILGDEALIERSANAHSMVKKQFDFMTILEGPALVEAFRNLRAIVDKHVADEESNLLPALAAQATPQQLEELGARILQAKQRVG